MMITKRISREIVNLDESLVKGCAWSDDFLIGDEVVDFQHQKLFEYLNLLIAATKSKESHSIILKDALSALIEYAHLHFEDEELVLESNGYRDLLAHQELHNDFRKKILDFKERFSRDEDVVFELIKFIQDWLVIHIQKEDMKALRSLPPK